MWLRRADAKFNKFNTIRGPQESDKILAFIRCFLVGIPLLSGQETASEEVICRTYMLDIFDVYKKGKSAH